MIRFFGSGFFLRVCVYINLLSERSEDNIMIFYYNRVQNCDILIFNYGATGL